MLGQQFLHFPFPFLVKLIFEDQADIDFGGWKVGLSGWVMKGCVCFEGVCEKDAEVDC